MKDLSLEEKTTIQGGIIPALGLYLAFAMAGYTIGKDVAQKGCK